MSGRGSFADRGERQPLPCGHRAAAGLPRLLKFWDDLNYGNLLVGANSGSNHEILAQRQNGIHTKLYEALASGDTEVACRAVYAHYMEPMERMRSANSAVQAADEAAK